MIGTPRLSAEISKNREGVSKTLLGSGGGFTAYLPSQDGRAFQKMSGRRSKYTSDVPLSFGTCRPSRVLVVSEDPSVRDGVEAELASHRAAYDEARAAVEARRSECDSLKRAFVAADQAAEAKRKEQGKEKALVTDIAVAEKKVAAAKKDMRDLDVNKEKKIMTKKINLSFNKRLDYLEQLTDVGAAILNAEFKLGAAKLSLEMAKDLQQCRRADLERERSDLVAKEQAVEEAKLVFKDIKDRLKAARDIAQREAPLVNSDRTPTPLAAAMNAANLPLNRSQVVEIMDAAQSSADAIHDNPAVIRQYNERKAEIAALQTAIETMVGAGGERMEQFNRLRRTWEEGTKEMCMKLNALFTNYMAALGNEGRVEVKEDPDSYDRWGINLLVSFRTGGAMVPLKKSVQSGGERSVSTIMFLMALQDMVRSPFRVVDEINQGMDERNERLVFKRIVENSVGAARPQYFLITPKLLQGLTAMEHEDVTVLFVFNGPYNLSRPDKWSLPTFFEKAPASPLEVDKRPRSNAH